MNGRGKSLSVLLAVGVLFTVTQATDPEPIEFPGQVKIAVLLDVHSSDDSNSCAHLRSSSVQKFLAAVWAVQLLNSQNEPNATKIGLTVYDTCGSTETALRQIYHIIEREQRLENELECNVTADVPILGVIGLGETRILDSAATILNAFSIPMIVASPGGDYSPSRVKNVLYTAPEMASQVTSVLGVLRAFQWESARIISSSLTALREFSASVSDIQVAQAVHLAMGKVDDDILDTLFQNPTGQPLVIVALLEPEELQQLSVFMKEYKTSHDVAPVTWVVASPSLDRDSLTPYVENLGPGIFMEPHSPELAGFQHFFESMLRNGESLGDATTKLIMEYNRTSNCFHSNCQKREFHQVPGVAHVSEAASALAAGLRILTLDSCHQAARCQAVTRPVAAAMLGAMHKLGLSFRRDQPPEIEGSRLRFTDSGRLVTVHSHVVYFNGTHPPTLIGWFSEELGVSLVTVPGSLARARLDANEYQQMWAERVAASTTSSAALSQDIVAIVVERVSHRSTVRRAWAAAVLALACIGVIAISHMFVYVLRNSCSRGESLRELIQPLDVAFAFAVAAMYATCIFFVLPSFHGVLGWRLLIHTMVHAMCYSVMLAQTLLSRWQNLLDVGGSIDSPSLLLVMVLAIVPQVMVSGLWFVWAAPSIHLLAPSNFSVLNGELVVLHIPAVALLVLVAIFSMDNRSAGRTLDPRNRCLFFATVACMPVWAAWAAVTYAGVPELQEPATCAHLLIVATVVGLAVFVPRVKEIRQRDAAFRHKKLPVPDTNMKIFSLTSELAPNGSTAVLVPPKPSCDNAKASG